MVQALQMEYWYYRSKALGEIYEMGMVQFAAILQIQASGPLAQSLRPLQPRHATPEALLRCEERGGGRRTA